MSNPVSEDFTENVEEPTPPETKRGFALDRHLIGIVLGIVLAAIVYFIMPDTVPEGVAAAAPEGKEFTAEGLRITAALAILMGTWWMTDRSLSPPPPWCPS